MVLVDVGYATKVVLLQSSELFTAPISVILSRDRWAGALLILQQFEVEWKMFWALSARTQPCPFHSDRGHHLEYDLTS